MTLSSPSHAVQPVRFSVCHKQEYIETKMCILMARRTCISCVTRLSLPSTAMALSIHIDLQDLLQLLHQLLPPAPRVAVGHKPGGRGGGGRLVGGIFW